MNKYFKNSSLIDLCISALEYCCISCRKIYMYLHMLENVKQCGQVFILKNLKLICVAMLIVSIHFSAPVVRKSILKSTNSFTKIAE